MTPSDIANTLLQHTQGMGQRSSASHMIMHTTCWQVKVLTLLRVWNYVVCLTLCGAFDNYVVWVTLCGAFDIMWYG